jgi:hypothetical protein
VLDDAAMQIMSLSPNLMPPPPYMFALVQVRPEAKVLAISPHRDRLQREIEELNATWNLYELRDARYKFEIQDLPAPLVDMPPAPKKDTDDAGTR